MSKWKKWASILLATIMLVTLMTACGTDSGANSGTGSGTSSDEVVTLRVWTYGLTASSDECAAVAEAISEITREKIGVEVELVRSSDGEKLNLALTSGEKLDLVNYHTFSGGLSTLVNNGMATPLEDLVEEYGQDALAVINEDLLACGSVDGTLYSLPDMKDFASAYGIAMRKDVLDEIGVDPADIKTWDDIHDVLVKVKEEKPEMYPLVPSWGGGGMQKAIPYDNLGTGFLDALGVLENAFDGSTTVVNLYETDAYRELCDRMYQWNQEGLIMPDATTSTEANLCATVGFADFENDNPAKASGLLTDWGHEGVVIRTVEPFMSSNAGGSSFFIPSESQYPEKAMQLWNLMYTDPEIATMFALGIEGVNYRYVDEEREHVEMIDGSTYDYQDWAWPNSWITPVMDGDDVDKWDQLKAFCDGAAVSPALGFTFDTTNVMNEITACNNVIAKYEVGLRWGVLDPDEALPKFNEELKAAGLETIIAEKQAQLDAFLGK